MARLRVTATALAAGALLWSSYAKADPITVNASANGGPTVHILTNTSPISFAGATEGGFVLTGSSVGTPPDLPGRFSSNSISVASASPGEHLLIWFTEQNLTNTSGLPLIITSGLTANLLFDASATLSTYIEPANTTAPPTGTPLATFNFTTNGAHSFMSKVPSPPGMYSLQEVYDITAIGTDEATNLTIDLVATAVPEPGSLVLVGTGLLGLGLLLFRKRVRPTQLAV